MLNTHLAGKTFMVAQRITLADLAIFVPMSIAFGFVLDAGFRKAMPNVSDWFARVAAQSCVIRVAGNAKMCEKALKPVDYTKLPVVNAPAKPTKTIEEVIKVEEKPAAADDDEFDPFADDDEEDEEEEKAKQARFKEIAKTAKSYGKKPAVAKSIIIWEVKPWGEETDLVALAAKIIAIEKDGLFWKTEWKKEPIAYGVFKIVIGATIEDDKISTDDI
jgi:translation elongation factor EF-1beta